MLKSGATCTQADLKDGKRGDSAQPARASEDWQGGIARAEGSTGHRDVAPEAGVQWAVAVVLKVVNQRPQGLGRDIDKAPEEGALTFTVGGQGLKDLQLLRVVQRRHGHVFGEASAKNIV